MAAMVLNCNLAVHSGHPDSKQRNTDVCVCVCVCVYSISIDMGSVQALFKSPGPGEQHSRFSLLFFVCHNTKDLA